MKQLVKAGAKQVLKRLPIDQADTIVKSFGFKPGSAQDVFVRQGGIHPTDGPGIINSIQKGEAQDLPQHITNAVGGEPNNLTRFSDNSTNQLNEETIKANGLKQVNANKVGSEFQPQKPLWKSGKGSRPSNTKLRENVGSFLQDRYSKTDELLDPEKRMDLINRKEFGEIHNEQGELMEISGVHSYMRSVNEGAPDPAKIKIGKVSTRQRGNVARIERMRAPEEELYKYASNNNISEQDVAAYLKEYSKGFNQVKKASSLNTKMGDPSDAGHWISTMASTGPGPLDRAATSKRAARIENRFQNRSGGAKSSHDMNPHAAEIVGIPRNWKEDFLLFLDQRPGGPNKMPNWMVEMQTKDLDALLAIPPDASKKEVEAVFDDLVKGWRKDKNHWAKQIKDIQRDLKVKKPSDNPDYYLYGKDQEIDEYAPIPGDPDFE